MKLVIATTILLLTSSLSLAQWTKHEYDDENLGWLKIYYPNEPTKPISYDHRSFSAKQLAIANLMRSWVQASYHPKGAIGAALRVTNDKLGLYNEHTKAMPSEYGVYSKTYFELKKNEKGNYIPYTNSHWWWYTMANGIIGDYVRVITSPEQYYFYIPGEAGDPYQEITDKNVHVTAFKNHPGLKKYVHFYQPSGIGIQSKMTVVLCKDNQLPYIQITKGEFLEQYQKGIERDHIEKLKKFDEDFNVQRKESFKADENEKYTRRIAAFNKLKDKYKNRLTEKAAIYSASPDIYLENSTVVDVFEGNNASELKIPVYKFDPAKIALCKTDTPQWITFTWSVPVDHAPSIYQHQSILNNFNFDYAYNYFFNPEKVKGVAYKPLGSPVFSEQTVLTEKSKASKEASNNSNVFFFEDFSENPAGQKPINWKSNISSSGTTPVVKEVKGMPGKWIELVGHNAVYPSTLGKPLPQDFELSFDVAVPKDIPWGAKAFTLYLGTAKNYVENGPCINLRIRAGFSGRPGETSLECKFGSGYPVNVKPYYDATGFSNDKEINKVTITLKKKGERLEYLIDNNSIADIPKAVPPGSLFNWLQLSHSRSDGDNQKYYISNIKVVKL
jgi:hypothetical protein